MKVLRAAFLIAVTLLVTTPALLAERDVPGAGWERLLDPERHGWSSAKLQAVREHAATLQTAALMIVADGKVVDQWGETTTRYNLHSIRKSLLSALYGIHVADGCIDLSKTMDALGIDDNEPALTPAEKQAAVGDLLKARSGVYHPALYETPSMKARRPARATHAPGSFWYYNNWDFNVLGTIFERLTKAPLFADFKARIADAIGMQDFRLEDGAYVTGPDSIHPAYPFRMTARDLARFGLLYLRGGRWGDREIVPKSWIDEGLAPYSDAGGAGGYGYMWWVAVNGRHLPGVTLPEGSYSARGAGGHYLLIVPKLDLLVVHRVNTDVAGRSVSNEEFGRLVKLILDARETVRSPLP